MNRRIRVAKLFSGIIATVLVFSVLVFPALAFAADNNLAYMDINANIGSFQGGLLARGSDALQNIVLILLPIALIICSWRVIYFAIFPLMAGIDPLNMAKNIDKNGKYISSHAMKSTGTSEFSKADWKGDSTYIKRYIVRMTKYMFIVFAVWGIITIIIYFIITIVKHLGS